MNPCPNHPAGRTCPACDKPLTVTGTTMLVLKIFGWMCLICFFPIPAAVGALIVYGIKHAARMFSEEMRR